MRYVVNSIFALAALPAGVLAAPDPPAQARFRLSFDGDRPLVADTAAGRAAPTVREGVRVVPGLEGQGAYLAKTDILAYAAPGNLDKARGSIALWAKPSFPAAESGSDTLGYPCFFKEDAPLGPVPVNNIWLWVNNGRFRYDLRIGPNDMLNASPRLPLQDAWHHLVITWDCREGMRLYIDGYDVSFFVSDKPYGMRPKLTWEPQAHAQFFVGNRGRDTYHTESPLWGGCQSVIDNFAIYDRPLSRTEVADLYRSEQDARGLAPLFLARLPAVLADEAFRPVIDVRNPFSTILRGEVEVRLQGDGQEQVVASRRIKLAPGRTLTLRGKRLRLAPGSYELVYSVAGIVRQSQTLSVLPRHPACGQDPERTLIAGYAASDLIGSARYRESAPASVKTLGPTTYLEAGSEQFDRVAFRFEVRNAGKPHLLRLAYPDDRERLFDVIINSPNAPHNYDTQGGVLTGRELENTGGIETYDMVYWPRECDQALLLTTWCPGMPAALSRFDVYELGDRLPSLRLSEPRRKEGRHLGLYWEDPMLSECFGGRNHEREPARFTAETADRMVDTMKWCGLDTLIYPVAFYQGPGFRTLAEDLFAMAGAERHPENYIAIILRRFAEAGDFGFIPEINCCLSRRLLEPVSDYAARPEAGYVAVSKTGEMNTGVFPRLNVLHPLYQDRFCDIVRDMCRQFGDSKAFKGVQLHLVKESSFWFSGLDWGYDGYTVSRFSRETGMRVPDVADGNVYARRYDWLMAHAHEQWVDWRCRQVTEFYGRLADVLRATRRDLKLVIGLRYLAEGSSYLPDWERAGRSMKTAWREAGLDIEGLAQIENVQVQKYFYPSDIKWQRLRARGCGNGMYAGLELRRSDELRETLTLGGSRPVATNLYLNYFESAVGRDKPIPGFWWACPRWRVCALSPGGRSYLELFAESVALYDAPMITTGGFLVGILGHGARVREFAQAYRALPALPFETVPVASDAVVVRCARGGWLYAVSRAPFELELSLRFHKAQTLTDLTTRQDLQGEAILVKLKPYQLRSFRGTCRPRDVSVESCRIPASRREAVAADIARLRAAPAPGPDLAEELARELAADQLIRCKHILEQARTLDLLGRTAPTGR